MNVSTHEAGFESLDGLAEVDSLCLFVAEDDRPLKGIAGYVDWRLCGQLSRIILQGFFTGTPGDCLLLPSDGHLAMPRVFAVGLGPGKRLTSAGLGGALNEAARILSRARAEAVAVEIPGAGVLDDQARAAAFTRQFLPEFKGKRVAVLSDKGLGRLIPGAARAEK